MNKLTKKAAIAFAAAATVGGVAVFVDYAVSTTPPPSAGITFLDTNGYHDAKDKGVTDGLDNPCYKGTSPHNYNAVNDKTNKPEDITLCFGSGNYIAFPPKPVF